MRITNQMTTNRMLQNINRNAKQVDNLYTQLASGKKIQNPSDDPIIASRALKFRTIISETEQYARNASQATSWMSITEEGFTNTLDILETIRTRLVQGATDTLTSEDREKIIDEIRSLAQQIGDEMNVSYAGRYVFSGYRTNQPAILTKDEVKAVFDISQYFNSSDIQSTKAFAIDSVKGLTIYDIFKIDLPYKGYVSETPETAQDMIEAYNDLVTTTNSDLGALYTEFQAVDPTDADALKSIATRLIDIVNEGSSATSSIMDVTDTLISMLGEDAFDATKLANYRNQVWGHNSDPAHYMPIFYSPSINGANNAIDSIDNNNTATAYAQLSVAINAAWGGGGGLPGCHSPIANAAWSLLDGIVPGVALERVSLSREPGYVIPNAVSDPKNAAYDPSDINYNATVDPSSDSYDNKNINNIKYALTAVTGTTETKYAVTVMHATDPDYDNRYNPGPNAIYFIPETGELVFGEDVAREISEKTGKDGVGLNYNVKELYEGEINPVVYFDCTDKVTGKSYSMNNQDIRYEVGTNTQVQINNLAKDAFTATLYAELMNFIDMVSSVTFSTDSDLYAKYQAESVARVADGGEPYTEEEIKKLVEDRQTLEEKRYSDYLHSSFSNMLGRYDVTHYSQVLKEYTTLGSRMDRVALTSSRLEQNRVSYTQLMSDNENVDYAEAATKMVTLEAVYSASLMVSGRISQMTLADYI